MKKMLLVLLAVSPVSFASSVDEMVKDFERSGIYSADWYEKGASKIAESSNKYRDIKINLQKEKGAILVMLPSASDFDSLAIYPCLTLTKFIPYKKADTWGDPSTEDEIIVGSVFNANTKVGQENIKQLNGWNMQFKRLATGFSCLVEKAK